MLLLLKSDLLNVCVDPGGADSKQISDDVSDSRQAASFSEAFNLVFSPPSEGVRAVGGPIRARDRERQAGRRNAPCPHTLRGMDGDTRSVVFEKQRRRKV
ncbi:hypothetical protein EYF80_021007 [Liparis tanakae]|uniref:Uncharacterized protein n=1 Tax=Liparis tanakae TaxID=230148 RepID=A0A4Z2HSP6_9TELE|nr:hypothetical protein EYF80_021007 [Liparis tanakae]